MQHCSIATGCTNHELNKAGTAEVGTFGPTRCCPPSGQQAYLEVHKITPRRVLGPVARARDTEGLGHLDG